MALLMIVKRRTLTSQRHGPQASYFSGHDPALELAISLNDISLESLLRNALARKDLHQVGRYTLDSKRSPGTYETNFSDLLLALGNEALASGDTGNRQLRLPGRPVFLPATCRA